MSGYAYAGDDRSVVRVDLSTDDGSSWQQANLTSSSEPWAWSLWQASLQLPPGTSRITVRAWDSTGASQPEHAAALWNPKGYINNAWGHITITSR